MSLAIIAQVQEAIISLPLLDREQRMALFLRLLSELEFLGKTVLASLEPGACVWIDNLVATVSAGLPEIAEMGDSEFQFLLTEFEKVISTLVSLGPIAG